MENVKCEETLYETFLANYDDHGTTSYIFSDDTFNDSIDKLRMFENVVRKLPFDITYAAYLRADLFARFPEMGEIILNTGCKSATFGLETLHNPTLKKIGKGLPAEKIIETLNILRHNAGWRNKINMSSGFIIGLPLDTQESVSNWINTIIDYDFPLDSLSINPLFIKRGSGSLSFSDIEKNYESYGYYFENGIWKNEHWTFESANELANDVTEYLEESGRTKLMGFSTFLAKSSGIDLNEMRYRSIVDIKDEIGLNMFYQAKQYFHKKLNK